MSDQVSEDRPLLRVINADATAEEIAALVAVFSALDSAPRRSKPPVDAWSAPNRQVRVHYSSGPGGWRASGLPQHRGRG